MLVEEIFESVQGEGHLSGKLSTFIRLYGCPVGCHWCDTGYGINPPQNKFVEMSIKDIVKKISTDHVVITGGEPFIHKELPDLCSELIDYACKSIQIETSGHLWIDLPDYIWITLSPKEHLTGKTVDDRFWERANEFKFIVGNCADFEYYVMKSPHVHLKIMFQENLYFQPEWNNRAIAIDEIMNVILPIDDFSHGKLSIQAHKYLGLQ